MTPRDFIETRIKTIVKLILLKNRCPYCYKLYESTSDIQIYFGSFIERFAFSNYQPQYPTSIKFKFQPSERKTLINSKVRSYSDGVVVSICCLRCYEIRELIIPQ